MSVTDARRRELDLARHVREAAGRHLARWLEQELLDVATGVEHGRWEQIAARLRRLAERCGTLEVRIDQAVAEAIDRDRARRADAVDGEGRRAA